MSSETTSSAIATCNFPEGSTSEKCDPLKALLPNTLAKLKQRRISDSEVPCLGDTPRGIDSGYATAESTPGGKSGSQEDGAYTPSKQPRVSRFLQRRIAKLRLFDKEIPQSTRNRFEDLVELFSQPLYEHLKKAKTRHGPISIKLKVVGENEADARPWIIVLCDKAVARQVRQFFDLLHVKTECQPTEADSFVPSFKVLMESRPPREVAATTLARTRDWLSEYTEVYCREKSQVTLCGTKIHVAYPDAIRTATLGGIVKVIDIDGSTLLFGITAGHILREAHLNFANDESSSLHLYRGEADNSEDSTENEGDDNEYILAGEETFELEMGSDDDRTQQYQSLGTDNVPAPSSFGDNHFIDGHIFAVSGDTEEDQRDFDWALIRLYDSQSLRPNLLVLTDAEQVNSSTDKELIDCAQGRDSISSGTNQFIYLLSSSDGIKHGVLSLSKSFLALSTTQRMIPTYSLSFPSGSGLNQGDCGSWVVDAHNYKVYGHVVAVDIFNEGYVVPLESVFRNIEGQLPAKSVGLAEKAEIQQWRETMPPFTRANKGRELTDFLEDGEYQAHSTVDSNSTFPAFTLHDKNASAEPKFLTRTLFRPLYAGPAGRGGGYDVRPNVGFPVLHDNGHVLPDSGYATMKSTPRSSPRDRPDRTQPKNHKGDNSERC